MQRLGIPGEDRPGVMNALELIAAYKTGRLRELQGTVVVVGAGNTAIDAANAARRLGAETVYVLYRRGEKRHSGVRLRIRACKAGGRAVPVEARAVCDQARMRTVACCSIPCRCTRSDKTLVQVPDSQFTIWCNMVVPAIGQSPLWAAAATVSPGRGARGAHCGRSRDRATGNPRYFAGGDCVNGGREVVDAVADGKRAALAMLKMAEAAYA